jgi:hypothetical protein
MGVPPRGEKSMRVDSMLMLCALILVASFTTGVRARTWVVAGDGSGDLDQVSEACLAASQGDTVQILPGLYDEYTGPDSAITLQNKGLCIRGAGTRPEDVGLRMRFELQTAPRASLGTDGTSTAGCPAGIYFVHVRDGRFSKTARLIRVQ